MVRRLSLVFLLAVAACDGARDDDDVQSMYRTDDPAATDTSAAGDRPDPALVIRPEGIGHAMSGLTVGDLRRALPDGARIGELDDGFMVDLVAAPVTRATDTLYYLLFPTREALEDSLRLEMVATANPKARTADGLGPGMTLADAAALRGPPTLVYSTHDESREYARFEAQPPSILFRVRPAAPNGTFAGTYTTSGEYNTTTQYDTAAVIFMVIVNLGVAGQE